MGQDECMNNDEYSPSMWPPKGHAFVYNVTSKLENPGGGQFELFFQMTVPKDRTTELTTLRVSRLGGPTESDLKFRAELFPVIGSITVAGGHIEAAMKRLLLILSDKDSLFSLADFQWGDLHKKLVAQCSGENRQRQKLKDVLDWAERKNLRERRHTVVHGSWWLYSLDAALVSRWPRKQEGHIQIDSLENLRALEKLCWEFDRKLDQLAGESWPRAVLPAPEVPIAFRRAPGTETG